MDMRVVRIVLIAIGMAILAAVAIAFSAAMHANTKLGLAAAKTIIERSGSDTSRGTVRISRVRSLPPRRFSILDYRMIAPNGEVVISADELAGDFDPSGLLDGQIRFTNSAFVRAHIRLTRG